MLFACVAVGINGPNIAVCTPCVAGIWLRRIVSPIVRPRRVSNVDALAPSEANERSPVGITEPT